jgi:hypothetical protein
MFELYAQNRSAGKPNLITADFLLLTHSLALDQVTAEFEEKTAGPALAALAKQLSAAAKDGLAHDFAAVLEALTTGASTVAGEAANGELRRVLEGKGIERSALLLQNIDYTQFQPRGRYTRTPALTNYFRAYRYASAVLFPVVDSRATGISAADADALTAAALALTRAITGDPGLRKTYEALEGHLGFFFGPPDDLTLSDYAGAASAASPAEARKQLFELKKRPRILGSVVDATRLEPGRTVYDVVTGFRLVPQRYSADSAALGELVYPHGGAYQGKAEAPFTMGVINGQKMKAFPSGKELMALLGSARATALLEGADDTSYAGYKEASAAAARALDTASGLPGRQLAMLRIWLHGATPADADQRLRAALASWTAYRYAGLLYVKQSYSAVGKGLEMPRERAGAWIDPEPELYLLLRQQVSLVRQHGEHPALATWESALDQCIDIAYAAKRGVSLDARQEEYLNSLDEILLTVVGKPDKPIVVDVHTEPNSGLVVEEGIGFPVSASVAGHPAVGARFSHHEFKQPMKERLTDEAWVAKLRTGFSADSVPPQASPKPAAVASKPAKDKPGRFRRKNK